MDELDNFKLDQNSEKSSSRDLRQPNTKRGCCFTFCFILLSLITIAVLSLTLFLKRLINFQIKQGVLKQVILTPDNVNHWGNVPGSFDIKVTRNISMLNWTNPGAVTTLTSNTSKTLPEFKLTDSVILRERSNVSDLKSLHNGEQVSFTNVYNLTIEEDLEMEKNDKQGNKTSNSAKNVKNTLDNEVTIPNVYAFAVWRNSKIAKIQHRALATFGSLYLGFIQDDTIYMQGVTAAINILFMSKDTTFETVYNRYLQHSGLPQPDALRLYEDSVYGWRYPGLRKFWFQAQIRGHDSQDFINLRLYFGLTTLQLTNLLKSVKPDIDFAQMAIKNSFNCPKIPCDSGYLTKIQLASQNVSENAPGKAASPSAKFSNMTVYGYPEITYYFSEVFAKKISNDSEYRKAAHFSLKQLDTWLAHDGDLCAKSWSSLIHYTNIDDFFAAGQKFDETQDLSSFESILERFLMQSTHQARIVYEYLKYMATDFAEIEEGDFNLSAKTDFFVAGIRKLWEEDLRGLIKPTLLEEALKSLSSSALHEYSCKQSIALSSPRINISALSRPVCSSSDSFVDEFVGDLVEFCQNRTTAAFNKTFKNYNMKRMHARMLCQQSADNPKSLAGILASIEAKLAKHFNCSNPAYCGNQELTVMQWVNSSVTLAPPSFLNAKKYPKSKSLKNWFPKKIKSEFEFEALYPSITRPPIEKAVKSFFWRGWFSIPQVIRGIGEARKGNFSVLKNFLMMENDLEGFEGYLNSFVIEYMFGGNSVTATVKELLFGYKSPIVEYIKTIPAIKGGDPSVKTETQLMPNPVQITEIRHTGKGNISLIDQYQQLNGLGYINKEQPYYNGNITTTRLVNPWREEVPMAGSDNLYQPGLGPNSSILGFASDNCIIAESVFEKEVIDQKFGLVSNRFKLSDSSLENSAKNPKNRKYFMDVYSGAWNLSSVNRAPMYVSRMFFANVSEGVGQKVSILNSDGSPVVYGEDDGLYLEVQKQTGVPTRVHLDVQISVELPSDELFDFPKNTLLPLFIVKREMKGLTADQTRLIFGPLLLANGVIVWGRIVGFVVSLGLFLILVMLFCCAQCRRGARSKIIRGDLSRAANMKVYSKNDGLTDTRSQYGSNDDQSYFLEDSDGKIVKNTKKRLEEAEKKMRKKREAAGFGMTSQLIGDGSDEEEMTLNDQSTF